MDYLFYIIIGLGLFAIAATYTFDKYLEKKINNSHE